MMRRFGSRQYGVPLFIDRVDTIGTARVLDRVTLSATGGTNGSQYDEGWLQRLIHGFPQTLPIAEIEPGLTGVVPISMELPTPAGNIDNLFMTADGNLVLTECKLWRNPEARREVIAQIIDYAHCMVSWSYQDLELAVRHSVNLRGGRPSGSLYEFVGGDQEGDEAAFVDAVSRNLQLGRMLLLIIGDGIRTGVETLTGFLQGHAGFHFTLGVVEMAVHRMPGDAGFVIQPRVLARTINIERGIVRIEDGQPVIGASPQGPGPAGSGRRTSITEEHFFESLAARDPALPERLRTFLDRIAERGVTSTLGRSLILKWQGSGDRRFNLGCIYPNGDVRTDPVNWEADGIGRLDLAHDYQTALAGLINGRVRRTAKPAAWHVTADGKRHPFISQLLDVSDSWLALIDQYTARLTQALESREA